MATEMKISVNGGDVIVVPSILKDGLNYPNLRILAELLDIKIDYDAATKIVKLNK